ncbi:MAG: hypothetical protein EZS28_034109, partial [Streblomastix strix]
QQPLELFWRILGILNKANVIAKVSMTKTKLSFILEGQNMISRYLNVKISELRDKTQEEKQIEQQSNINQFNSIQFVQKNNSVEKRNLFEIIFPSENGSDTPIKVEGEMKQQTASFDIDNGSWLKYEQKVYSVLISNDRNIFTGKDGNVDTGVQLEVEVKQITDDDDDDDDDDKKDDDGDDDDDKQDDDDQQKDEQLIDPEVDKEVETPDDEKNKGSGISIGIIIDIAAGAFAIVAVIVIIVIVAIFISKKKKAKKVSVPFDPDMRARDLPMENKYPSNSHSLDPLKKALENNRW